MSGISSTFNSYQQPPLVPVSMTIKNKREEEVECFSNASQAVAEVNHDQRLVALSESYYNPVETASPLSHSDQQPNLVDAHIKIENDSKTTVESSLISSGSQELDIGKVDQNPKPVALFEKYYNSIETAHQSFLAIGDLSNLDLSARNFQEMEKAYKVIYQVDRQEAAKKKQDIDRAMEMLKEMNANSNTLTSIDLQVGIPSFFKKPIEETYTDKDGMVYIQPDHSGLLRFGSDFFLSGEYDSIGLLRHYKINGHLCDVLYLKKKQDQIDFESKHKKYIYGIKDYIFNGNNYDPPFKEKGNDSYLPSFNIGNFFNSQGKRSNQDISQLIKEQFLTIKAAIPLLSEKCQTWKYGKFDLCAEGELRNFGLSDEAASGVHAIFFYFKNLN